MSKFGGRRFKTDMGCVDTLVDAAEGGYNLDCSVNGRGFLTGGRITDESAEAYITICGAREIIDGDDASNS